MDFRPILFIVGLLLCTMSVSLALPMLVDLSFGNSDWKVFFFCILATGFFGGSLVISTASPVQGFSIRQAFMLLFLCWLCVAAFGSLPFYMCALNLSLTDSFFESMSGITTTGATILKNPDMAPPGILMWRAILQWLGGIGIIMMAISVLPFLKVGGMQLFRMQGGDDDQSLPRFARLAQSIILIYLLLTALCLVAYMLGGMDAFHALAHSMATISTGGFSTHGRSFMDVTNPWMDLAAIIFMIAGALPFLLYVKLLKGNIVPLLRDAQVRLFLSIIAIATLILSIHLMYADLMEPVDAVRHAAFNVVSMITGTSFTSTDYALWSPFALGLFLFLMAAGGCAGSTTCGMRMFRFQILYTVIMVQIKRLLHPSGVFVPYYNRRPIPEDAPLSVMSFFFVYALSFAGLVLALSFTGLDPLSAISASMAAISNAGPGFGPLFGEVTTYAALPNDAKWILSFGMLLGRLEFFTILVFLLPQYWRP
ncbi:MAG: TrkH family potassium uptake protein [Alphaproteobacteria bacterium]|nr:TrkH family potassium uptake protein [Alphaproteobacteria bacterium]